MAFLHPIALSQCCQEYAFHMCMSLFPRTKSVYTLMLLVVRQFPPFCAHCLIYTFTITFGKKTRQFKTKFEEERQGNTSTWCSLEKVMREKERIGEVD